MTCYNITFSPTGGTQKVADSFTKAFCQNSTSIDLTDTNLDFNSFNFEHNDICIISVPSFGGRVPQVAVSRLKEMKAENSKAILICAYGNRAYEDTLLELKSTLESCGFCCIAAIAAVAEHSIMHQFAKGRPNDDDYKELTSFAAKIKSKIEEEENFNSLVVPGNYPYREYKGVPMKPAVNKSCIKCGLCVTKCPVNAISVDTPSKTDKSECISCMRCVAICPAKARSVSKIMLTIDSEKMKKICSVYHENELFL